MATIANLDINLRANTKKFDAPIKQSQKTLMGFSASTVAVATTVAASFAAIGAAISQATQAGDEIDKISARTRIAAEDVQSLTFAFEQNGGSANDLETSVRSLNRNILDLQRGSATAVDNFRDLGLSMKDLEGLDMGERFRVVASALRNIQDESLQAGVALKVFGRSGSQLLPLLDNFEKLEQQYKNLGIAFSDDQVKLAAELTDQWNIFFQTTKKIGAELLEAFGPTLKLGLKLLGQALSNTVKMLEFINVLLKPINDLMDFGSFVLDKIFGTGVSGAGASTPANVGASGSTIVQRDLLNRLNSTERESLGVLKSINRGVNKPKRVIQPTVLR